MKKGVWFVLALSVVVGIAAGAFWLGGRSQFSNTAGSQAGSAQSAVAPKAPAIAAPPIPVDASRVKPTALAKVITTVGSLRSDETVIVRPEVSGRIAEIGFREGQQVAKGTTLIRLDQSIQRAEMQQAEANLALAKSRIQRSRDLHSKGFISSQAKDEAESSYKVAQAAFELAAARLTKLEIKAPFSGFVGLRMVSVGDYVREGQDMVNLEAIGVLKVDFRIPEVFLKEVKVRQALKVTLDAIPNQTFDALVLAINPLLDANGRALVVRAGLKNVGTRLRPGMFARVSLASSEQQTSLTVPEQSLIPVGDDVFVFKIVDNRALRTKVEVGQRQTGIAEITRGLRDGDVVVTAGQPKLRDGASVKLATVDGASAGPAAPTAPSPSPIEVPPAASGAKKS
ncbi:MAG: efflux RND transporter periplasmic adaptor subunit [Burkholderiales bacterium]|jgi:membrane fusion protein (multidrug efflux system)|nr:efflux RND transporter periplasmic adaptor subunit [Betaproteobacteria bacterium]